MSDAHSRRKSSTSGDGVAQACSTPHFQCGEAGASPAPRTSFLQIELDDDIRISRLARFNGEKARGIAHTEDWRDLMAGEQEWWNQRERAAMFEQGGEEVSPGVWLVPPPKKRRWWR